MAIDIATPEGRTPPKFANKIMTLLLRSPLHGLMSNSILLLSYKGRKSGKMYTLPLGYVRQGDTVTLLTDHKWWINLRDQPSVVLLMQGKAFKGTAEVIHENKEMIVQELLAFVQQHKGAARAYGVQIDTSGQPDPKSARQAAQRFTLIRIQLSSEKAPMISNQR